MEGDNEPIVVQSKKFAGALRRLIEDPDDDTEKDLAHELVGLTVTIGYAVVNELKKDLH